MCNYSQITLPVIQVTLVRNFLTEFFFFVANIVLKIFPKEFAEVFFNL